jgi:hypothetical protein
MKLSVTDTLFEQSHRVVCKTIREWRFASWVEVG